MSSSDNALIEEYGLPAPSQQLTAETLAQLHVDPSELGVLIVDHGSRRAESNALLLEVARRFQQVTQLPLSSRRIWSWRNPRSLRPLQLLWPKAPRLSSCTRIFWHRAATGDAIFRNWLPTRRPVIRASSFWLPRHWACIR